MNFIFRSYPTHPWISDWTFEPIGCNTAYRENCSDHFFRSRETVGQVAPNIDQPDWVLQIPVPQNSSINLLANGFCAYFDRRKVRCGAEVLSPEPGILCGRFLNIPRPVLVGDQRVEESEGMSWMETDTQLALVMVRDDRFCLVTKSRIHEDAVRIAEEYCDQEMESMIQSELDRRAGAAALFEDLTHHDSLAVICVESMMKALRPAEGRIPHLWSQSSVNGDPCFDLNELCPLVLAWNLIDPATARELLLSALKIQSNAGALPVHFSPHTTYSINEAPKPLFAKAAEMLWETDRNPDFLDSVLPLLRRQLQWLLHHFDPKRRRIYSWKSRQEALVPELYQTDLVTADLAVLLLTEIEALNRLRVHSVRHADLAPFFEEERLNIEQSLLEQFWNEQEEAFSNAYLRDAVLPLHGLPEIVPLLWKGLPQSRRAAILDHLRSSETLPAQRTAMNWHKSALDDRSFPLLQQFQVFEALRNADPGGTLLSDFSRVTLQGFLEWHSLSLEAGHALTINPATAAFILNVQSMHKYRHQGKPTDRGRISKVMRKARVDRTDALIVGGTLLLLFCIHAYYEARQAPPPRATLEARMLDAYSGQDVDTALQTAIKIMRIYPEEAAHARLLAANLLMMGGRYPEATELYQQVRREYPDSPGAMVSLGLAFQLQGRFDEAESNYYEFCYLFDVIFPEAVEEVNRFRFLMQEEFREPPKWEEIYRYSFMHEL